MAINPNNPTRTTCRICSAPGDLARRVDEALLSGQSLRVVGRMAGVSPTTVARHRDRCVSRLDVAEVAAVAEDGEPVALPSLQELLARNDRVARKMGEIVEDKAVSDAVRVRAAAVAGKLNMELAATIHIEAQMARMMAEVTAAFQGDTAKAQRIVEAVMPVAPQMLRQEVIDAVPAEVLKRAATPGAKLRFPDLPADHHMNDPDYPDEPERPTWLRMPGEPSPATKEVAPLVLDEMQRVKR